jgi:hypothetical protein
MKVYSTLGRALVVGLALTAAAPSSVWAQGLGGMGGSGGGMPPRSPTPKAEPETPPLPTPDAVPGAKARTPVAPATHAAGDMQPTEALFDAINRGDLEAARDSVNRGADLDGVNILGMTPMELSVDLGRNDISFMLLSMRGEDSGRGSRAVGHSVAEKAAPAARTASRTPTAAKHAVRPRSAAAPAAVHVQAAKPAGSPKLFANDGGTPLPSAGFLGFDRRSATN